MKMWDRYREDRNHRQEIERQMQRIDQLSKVVPEQTLDMQLWGWVPQEIKTLEQAEQWLSVLKTAHIRRVAERYGIEMPDMSDIELGQRMDWDDDQAEPYYLTAEGFRRVRRDIRSEQDYQWNKWNTRIAIATGPLGIIVAVLALLVGK